MDTSAFIYAHHIIVFSSVIVCDGVRGSAASELAKQRNGCGDSSTDAQSGEGFANMIRKVQLVSFVVWCKHVVECLRELEDGLEGSDLNDAGAVEDIVRVNKPVVDNELRNTDVTMLPSWRKFMNGLKRSEFSPSKWQSYVRDDGMVCICVG